MKDSSPVSGRKLAGIFTLSLIAAIAGTLFAYSFVPTLKTTPAWLGPAIVIGAFTILVGGLLLLPTAVRAMRASRNGPAA